MDTDINVTSPSLIESTTRYRRGVIAAVAIAAFLGAIVGVSGTVSYTAKAHAVLAGPADHLQFGQTTNVSTAELERTVEIERRRAASSQVADAAAARLGGTYTGDEVRAMTSVTRGDTSLTFSATSPISAEATAVADAVVAAYLTAKDAEAESVNELALAAFDQELLELRDLLDTLGGEIEAEAVEGRAAQQAIALIRERRAEFALDAAIIGNGVLLVEPATLEPNASPFRIAAIGAVVGGLVGLIAATAGAWLMTTRRPLARDQHEPAAVLGVPLLGRVPTELRARKSDRLRAPAAFQLISSAIAARVDGRVTLVTGTGATSSSSVARHVGATFARDGRRVVVVDTHADGVGVSGLLGPNDDTSGLAELLRTRSGIGDTVDIGAAAHTVTLLDDARFDVIPVGRVTDDLEYLMRTDRVHDVVGALRNAYDVVLIDAAPLLESSIASSGSRHADAMVIVVPDDTELSVLEDVRHLTSVMRAPVIGYVYCSSEQVPLDVAARSPWADRAPSVPATTAV